MSFILDALRKIDRERPAQGANAGSFAGAPTSSRDEARHRRDVTVMASIAVASAVLTAVGFTLVSRSGDEAGTAPLDAAVAPSETRFETPPPSIGLRPETRELPPASSPREEAPEIEIPAPGRATELEVVESQELADAPVEPEPEPEEPAEALEAPQTENPPPTLPQLVLQGTSFINGIAVAVISDRRVFEGDTIEGAVVIRIDERSVELEFEGHRFTISL